MRTTNHPGIIATTTVLIVMVVAVALASTLILTSINSGQSSLALVKSDMVLRLAESCSQQVLSVSRLDSSYSGGAVNFPEGACTVSVSKNGSTWTADITSQLDTYTRIIRLVYTRTPSGITLISWQEI